MSNLLTRFAANVRQAFQPDRVSLERLTYHHAARRRYTKNQPKIIPTTALITMTKPVNTAVFLNPTTL